MKLLDYLKKILGDEEGQKAYDKIQADKDNVLLVDDKKDSKYVEKSELDTANQTITDYKGQLKDRDTQLSTLKGKLKDIKNVEDLETEIERLKGEDETTTKDYEAKLNKLNFDTKLEKAIGSYKPKNPKVLKGLLDMEKIKLVSDTFVGLEEQVNALKESDSYVFESETPGGGAGGVGGTGTIGGDTPKPDGGTMSFGERLAEEQIAASKVTEAQSKFFG